MREILFRGKRGNGEWVEGLPVRMDENYAFICDKFENYTVVYRRTVGLYTGMTDRKGQRIFEGDICRNFMTGEIFSVKWHEPIAGYVLSKNQPGGYLRNFGELFRAFDKYEVIGNVHDNPELLEQVPVPDCTKCEHRYWHDPECSACNKENGFKYYTERRNYTERGKD